MAQPQVPSIREILLTIIREQEPKDHQSGPPLTQTSVLEEASDRTSAQYDRQKEEALLTEWNDLFRTGYLSWGKNLSSPGPPFFHITQRGRQALLNLTRDPSNPAGYLRHLTVTATISPVANSYLVEGLECYAAGFYKASAVMVGAAAESVILESPGRHRCEAQKASEGGPCRNQ